MNNIERTCSVIAAGLLASNMAAVAQAQSPGTYLPSPNERGTPVTLVGCLQRESDYRKDQSLGKSGRFGGGVGMHNEYVLTNATTVSDPSAAASAAPMDCASAPTAGEAYQLTGVKEHNLKPMIGQYIWLSGELKRSSEVVESSEAVETSTTGTVGTSGTEVPQPTSGRRHELTLPKVVVGTFDVVRAAPAAAAAIQPAAPETIAEGVVIQEQPAPQPAATTGETPAAAPAAALPKTASMEPLVGLLGLLFLTCAFGLRTLRVRA